MSEQCHCGISVGELVDGFSPEEGVGSAYDLAHEFADDETLAVYVIHHEEAKDARNLLEGLQSGIEQLRQQRLQEE